MASVASPLRLLAPQACGSGLLSAHPRLPLGFLRRRLFEARVVAAVSPLPAFARRRLFGRLAAKLGVGGGRTVGRARARVSVILDALGVVGGCVVRMHIQINQIFTLFSSPEGRA